MKTHISLNVRNVRESIDFYTKMLGVEPSKVKKDYAKFDVANPPLNLTMNETEFESGGSLSHLGLQVRSSRDVESFMRRWEAEGLKTFEEKNTDCCYALQDKAWVIDPDGNNWEVFTVLEDSESLATGAQCCAAQPETFQLGHSPKASVCS